MVQLWPGVRPGRAVKAEPGDAGARWACGAAKRRRLDPVRLNSAEQRTRQGQLAVG